MTYSFKCHKCNVVYDEDYSFKEFDQMKAGELIVRCHTCEEPVERLMGGENTFIWFSDPKTLGTLAERNSKFRIAQEEEKDEVKREEKKKAGKYVPPKEVVVPWEAPAKKSMDNKDVLKERKERKKEYVAKYKPSERPSRPNTKPGR